MRLDLALQGGDLGRDGPVAVGVSGQPARPRCDQQQEDQGGEHGDDDAPTAHTPA